MEIGAIIEELLAFIMLEVFWGIHLPFLHLSECILPVLQPYFYFF